MCSRRLGGTAFARVGRGRSIRSVVGRTRRSFASKSPRQAGGYMRRFSLADANFGAVFSDFPDVHGDVEEFADGVDVRRGVEGEVGGEKGAAAGEGHGQEQ